MNKNLFLSDLSIQKPTSYLDKTTDDSIIYKKQQKSYFEDFFLPSEKQKFSFEDDVSIKVDEYETASILNLSFESNEITKKPKKTSKPKKLQKTLNFFKPQNIKKIKKPENIKKILKFELSKKITKTEKITKTDPKKKETGGCKCKNSKCLRLHCACFKTLGYCGPSCRCLDCLNKEEFKEARDFVIQKTKIIYKKAFQTKKDKLVQIGDNKIHKEGCNCKKGCTLNYCQCKKFGANCSPICRCESCLNDKVVLSQEEIRKIYKPCSRKKHKIIINTQDVMKVNTLSNIFFESYNTINSFIIWVV